MISPGFKNMSLAFQVRTSFHNVTFRLLKVIGKYPVSLALLRRRTAFVVSHLIMRFLSIIGWRHKQFIIFFFTLMINIGGKIILNVFIMDMKTASC